MVCLSWQAHCWRHDQMHSDISDKAKGHTSVKEPPYPIFEGVIDCKTRALMCLYLECNVYVKGIKGVGPQTLSSTST